MVYSAEEKVKWFAVSSRIVVFTLQFAANYFIKDHEPNVFKKPRIQISPQFEGNILEVLTEGLTRWDAQYFLHIAEYGYTYENTLAFFPLFPLILRFLALPFQIIANNAFHITAVPFFLTTHDTLVLMSIVLNSVLFVHSALLLHRLTLKVTKNEMISYISALLFCVNPASIFFSAAYSETLFCFLTLNALLYIESGHLMWGSVLIGLSSMARSNGLISIGYIAHRLLKTKKNSLSIVFSVIVFVSCVIFSSLPFVAYQFYCYTKYCVTSEHRLPEVITSHAQLNGYVLPGVRSPWCDAPIPLAYSYVQKHYWNVGFLNYYEIKQIPNFALAFPVLALTFFGVFKFVRSHGWTLVYLGFVSGSPAAILPTSCFPYISHLFALAVFSTLCVHVQVSTRLIFSSCPAIYWLCAEVVFSKMSVSKEYAAAIKLSKTSNAFFEPLANKKSKWKTLIMTERFLGNALLIRYYFFAYLMAGTAVFANNLPWT